MRIQVRGDGPALVLAGLLAAAGHMVRTDPPRARLRIRGRDGWVAAELSRDGGTPEILILEQGQSEQGAPEGGAGTIRVRSGWGADWLAPAAEERDCLALFSVRPDGAEDLETDPPMLIVHPDSVPRRLFGPRSVGVRAIESRSMQAHLLSLMVVRLLDLPAALCNTSVPGLLADTEGRRIAEAVLEEGRSVAVRLGEMQARLPQNDPCEILSNIRQRPETLEGARYLPGLRCPPLLDAIRRGADTRPWVPQRQMGRQATNLGVPADCNLRLAACLPRVVRAGFYPSPLDLLRAVA